MSIEVEKILNKERQEKTGYLDLGRCGLRELPDLSDMDWLETLIVADMWWDLEQQRWMNSKNDGAFNKFSFWSGKSMPPNLKKANFRNCNISNVSFLKELTCLVFLDISFNKVIDGQPLGELINLTSLFIRGNPVENWNFLENIQNIDTLYLSHNRLNDGKIIENLTKLTTLSLAHNSLSSTKFLEKLLNLTTLNLTHNLLKEADNIALLLNLKSLDVSFNQISDGRFLENLIKLDKLNIEQNPLFFPPSEVVLQGGSAVLNYFNERRLIGKEKSLEAKVVLIGEGQAGKTSLRTRLLHPGQALPTKSDRTKGLDIEIEQYRFVLSSGEIMKLNLFDFGGQDHYKPLHQFFYSKNTLYVLVTRNGDESTNDFDFWFDTAQLFGQGSPVLVVNNLFGDVRSHFNQSKFSRFADIIQGVKDTNLNDFNDPRWAGVKDILEYLSAHLPHVHEEIPKTWGNVRRALIERKEEQVLPLSDYLKICALPENGSMDRKRALYCSSYLHDIGAILHYQDVDDLKSWVIVRNEWATDATYKVIDDAEIANRNGVFTNEDLQRIWCEPEYEDHRPQLRELMRKFRLCYPLKGGYEFIIPQLLPVLPKNGYSWQPKQDLEMYIEYDFMPPGLIQQLIVECYWLIAEGRRLVWREGAVLEHKDGLVRAEIKLLKRNAKQTIGIKSQGSRKRDLLTIINDKVEELHRYFGKALRVERKIPCICSQCSNNIGEEKWFFNYSDLEELQDAGIKEYICIKSKKYISISELLGNIISEDVQLKRYDDDECSQNSMENSDNPINVKTVTGKIIHVHIHDTPKGMEDDLKHVRRTTDKMIAQIDTVLKNIEEQLALTREQKQEVHAIYELLDKSEEEDAVFARLDKLLDEKLEAIKDELHEQTVKAWKDATKKLPGDVENKVKVKTKMAMIYGIFPKFSQEYELEHTIDLASADGRPFFKRLGQDIKAIITGKKQFKDLLIESTQPPKQKELPEG